MCKYILRPSTKPLCEVVLDVHSNKHGNSLLCEPKKLLLIKLMIVENSIVTKTQVLIVDVFLCLSFQKLFVCLC